MKKIRRKYEERKIWGKQDPLKLVRVGTRRARTYVRMYACTCLYLEAYARARKPSLKVDGYVCWLDESCRAFLRWSISNFANALATTSWRESAVSPITTLWPSNGGIFYIRVTALLFASVRVSCAFTVFCVSLLRTDSDSRSVTLNNNAWT